MLCQIRKLGVDSGKAQLSGRTRGPGLPFLGGGGWAANAIWAGLETARPLEMCAFLLVALTPLSGHPRKVAGPHSL